jgi:hypothetical protein
VDWPKPIAGKPTPIVLVVGKPVERVLVRLEVRLETGWVGKPLDRVLVGLELARLDVAGELSLGVDAST